MSNEFTTNHELLRSPQYHKIRDMIERLENGGAVKNFAGNCISTADIVQHLLSRVGISSKIIETQVCLIRDDGKTKDYVFVGYDNGSYEGQIDTHTVVITEGERPILIDLSLGHLLPSDRRFVVEYIKYDEPSKLLEMNIANINITYFEKQNIQLPNIHQKNLLQRIVGEQKFEKTLTTLKSFILCALALGLINFTLNVILIVLRLFDITL